MWYFGCCVRMISFCPVVLVGATWMLHFSAGMGRRAGGLEPKMSRLTNNTSVVIGRKIRTVRTGTPGIPKMAITVIGLSE
jgi:hypothetical protein